MFLKKIKGKMTQFLVLLELIYSQPPPEGWFLVIVVKPFSPVDYHGAEFDQTIVSWWFNNLYS